MLEQKHNEEQKADAANSQPAYCKTDVTSRFSTGSVQSPVPTIIDSGYKMDIKGSGYIQSLVPQDFFDRYEQLKVLLSSLQKSVTDLEKVGVTVKCDFEFDAFDKNVSNIIEAYTLK